MGSSKSSFKGFVRDILLSLFLIVVSIMVSIQSRAANDRILPTDGLLRRFEVALVNAAKSQIGSSLKVDPESVQVSFEKLRIRPSLPILDNYDVQILGLGGAGSKRMDGLFQFVVAVEEKEGRQVQLDVSGIMNVSGPVIRANRNLMRGTKITDSDLSLTFAPWKLLPSGAAGTTVNELIGKVLRVGVNSGDPVYNSLTEELSVIKSGDPIEVTVIAGPGVIIRSRGIARQNANMGESIRIEQPDSKKFLSGIVTGTKTVEVRL